MCEAVKSGIDLDDDTLNRNNMSIYSEKLRNNNNTLFNTLSIQEQLKTFGYWNGLNKGLFYPNCYFTLTNSEQKIFDFCGIIAAFRTPRELKKEKKMGFYIGYDFGKYIDLIIPEQFYDNTIVGIKGTCVLKCGIQDIYQALNCVLF